MQQRDILWLLDIKFASRRRLIKMILKWSNGAKSIASVIPQTVPLIVAFVRKFYILFVQPNSTYINDFFAEQRVKPSVDWQR